MGSGVIVVDVLCTVHDIFKSAFIRASSATKVLALEGNRID